MKEQRFLSAAVEHERIAPLQTDDGFSVPRVLGQQKATRVLLERLGRGGSDVDSFRVGPRSSQEPRVNTMVVDHHVGGFEVSLAAYADERRIAWSSTHEVDARLLHGVTPVLTALRI